MLQNIRDNSQGWIAKTIIGVIIVLLSLTGFEAIFSSINNQQTVAKVNGEEVSQVELSQAIELQKRQLAQQFGSNFDPSMLDDALLRDSALKGLIDRKLLLQAAGDAKFAFSDAAIDQLILDTPEFQVDGTFSPERFDMVIRQMGYERLQFRALLQQEMLIGQLRAGVEATGFITDKEIRQFVRLERQTRDFATLNIAADPDAVQLSDEAIQAYYQEHAKRFTSPEQVVVEYVELKKSAFLDQVEVSEDDIQSLYESEIANLAEQRNAAHILIEEADDAKARIEELSKRLAAGEDFASLAKEYSADSGSATKGGELGYAGKDVYDPEFEKALFALKEGEVSAPVHSAFGWHLIKLLGVQAPEVPSLASLHERLEREAKEQQVSQRFIEVSRELESLAFEASDLQQPAQELDLNVQASEAFGRNGGDGIASNRQVVQAAFSQDVLEDGINSSLIELDPDTVVVLRVKEHQTPKQLELAQVRDSIVRQLRLEKATAEAKAKGEALIESLRSGKTPADQQQTWSVHEAVTRSQSALDGDVLEQVFRMPHPQTQDAPRFAGISLDNGDFVVLRLNGVNQADDTLADSEKAFYARVLGSRLAQQDFAAYRARLEAQADIERL